MRTHGHTTGYKRSRTHSSWTAMMARCYKPYSNRFYAYGAKGVSVCERWHNFSNFLEDLGERPPGCTLGRHSDQGDYEPGNVSWQTVEQQARSGQRNPRAKLTQEQADCMRALHAKGAKNGCSGANMAKELGMSPAQVSQVLSWKTYI